MKGNPMRDANLSGVNFLNNSSTLTSNSSKVLDHDHSPIPHHEDNRYICNPKQINSD